MVAQKVRSKQARKSSKKSRTAALARAREAKAAKHEDRNDSPSLRSSSLSHDVTPVTSVAATDDQEEIVVRQSASKRKLEYFVEPTFDDNRPLPFAFVDLNLVATLFSSFRCSVCSGNLQLTSDVRKGFAHQLKLHCILCGHHEASTMTSTTIADSKHYDVNRRMVLSFLNIGSGFAGMSTFCESMGLQGPTELSFARHVTSIHKASALVKSATCDEAVKKVRASHGATDSSGVIDIAVSYDGSWQKRGHTSKHGLGVVIEVSTGLVIDYHVMASYCQQCASVGAKLKASNEDQYNRWFDLHRDTCTINHQGSAGMMEVEVAKILWGRSMERGLRYTTLITDGDCKTFNELVRLSPYGDTPITKEECTNHVSKRLGTALRTLVSTEKVKGRTLGGRRVGSLSQVKIAVLQSHYKKAVASKCQTVEELRRKIFCTFYHASSTDENPQHSDCPTGKNSWCFYQRAIAFGKTPPSHKGKSSSFISAEVAKAVLPIYQRLTADALLERCLKGLTQNANESLHSTIWAKCPKHLFAGRRRVEIATTVAIATFNCGSKALQGLLRQSGCSVSRETVRRGDRRNRKRIATAEKRETLEAKRRRTEKARASTLAQQEYLRSESGPAYSSGAF